MRITVLTVCYNEAKTIEKFLTHYYDLGVNRIVIYDNKSTDNTVEICRAFEKSHQGCTINIESYDTEGQIRDDVYLQIKNEAWKKYKSDFYIVVDCDELLEVNTYDPNTIDDRKRLVRYLATMKKGYVLPRVLGVQVVTDTFEQLENANPNTDKMFVMDETFNKRCIFQRKYAPIYRAGCHTFGVAAKDREAIANSMEVEKSVAPLYLFHFKHIDVDYVTERYEEFKSRLSKYNTDRGYGHQYTMSKEAIKLKFEYLKRYAITLEEVFSNK